MFLPNHSDGCVDVRMVILLLRIMAMYIGILLLPNPTLRHPVLSPMSSTCVTTYNSNVGGNREDDVVDMVDMTTEAGTESAVR